MKNKINEVVTTFGDFDDPRINWEYLKFKMREFTLKTELSYVLKLSGMKRGKSVQILSFAREK